ncbi:MAG TPA: hypothetical protein VIU62_17815 [Chloroflexota bacterium]
MGLSGGSAGPGGGERAVGEAAWAWNGWGAEGERQTGVGRAAACWRPGSRRAAVGGAGDERAVGGGAA